MGKVKIIILYGLKFIGLFWLVRKMTKGKLRILCYHGISCQDEHQFLPVLFMPEATFAHRMALLARLNYPVLSLDRAIAGLRAGNLPDNPVVITFDDGWRRTFSRAIPIVRGHGFPVSVYVTSYYVEKRLPVLNVLLSYILWKSARTSLDLDRLGEEGLSGEARLDRSADRQAFCEQMLAHLEDRYPAMGRLGAFKKLCRLLEVDWNRIEQHKMFRLATPEAIHDNAALDGVVMEMHTHRHTFPRDSLEACWKEVGENKALLMEWTGKKPAHFCYPSGLYDKKQIRWLKEMGVQSATTVRPGLNDRQTSPWELSRFLDGENVSDIEFEAELCGISDYIRKLAGRETGKAA